MRTRTLLLAGLLALATAPALADFEAGQKARERRDYATAILEFVIQAAPHRGK